MTKTRLKTIFFLSLKYIFIFAPALWAGNRVDARQTVVDGDTLIIGREKIRFDKIDAYETGQTCTCGGEEIKCGEKSKQTLFDLIGSNKVSCDPSGRDIYGRLIAECFITAGGKKTSLNHLMARTGMAVVISKKDEKLLLEEAGAIRMKKGIWGCEKYELPADFRKNLSVHRKDVRPHDAEPAPLSGHLHAPNG